MKDKRKEYAKEYQKNNKDKIREAHKRYDSSDKKKEYMKEYNKEYREKNKNNPSFKLKSSTQHKLTYIIKKIKINTDLKSFSDLIDCSIEDFKLYFESKFTEEMNWNNYGRGKNKWCIDHIIPISSFNILDPIEFKKCYHYSNLQPLWFIANCEKSNKIRSTTC